MAIEITCIGCGKVLHVPDATAGKKGKCPQCGAILQVPAVEEQPITEEALEFEPPNDPPPSPRTIPSRPAEAQMKKCPFCAEEIMAEAVKCKHCGSMLDGSAKEQNVVVVGADPFAQYHTEIKGKKKGKITVVGYAGIGLGALLIIIAGMTFQLGQDEGLNAFLLGLTGLGFVIACYLWARR